MKLLINEKKLDWSSILSSCDPQIEFDNISNKFKKLSLGERLEKVSYDIYIFDIEGNVNDEIARIKKLKLYNPDIKSIIVTSEKNWKYRSTLISKGIDHFLFRESDLELLNLVINRINLKVTKTTGNYN